MSNGDKKKYVIPEGYTSPLVQQKSYIIPAPPDDTLTDMLYNEAADNKANVEVGFNEEKELSITGYGNLYTPDNKVIRDLFGRIAQTTVPLLSGLPDWASSMWDAMMNQQNISPSGVTPIRTKEQIKENIKQSEISMAKMQEGIFESAKNYAERRKVIEQFLYGTGTLRREYDDAFIHKLVGQTGQVGSIMAMAMIPYIGVPMAGITAASMESMELAADIYDGGGTKEDVAMAFGVGNLLGLTDVGFGPYEVASILKKTLKKKLTKETLRQAVSPKGVIKKGAKLMVGETLQEEFQTVGEQTVKQVTGVQKGWNVDEFIEVGTMTPLSMLLAGGGPMMFNHSKMKSTLKILEKDIPEELDKRVKAGTLTPEQRGKAVTKLNSIIADPEKLATDYESTINDINLQTKINMEHQGAKNAAKAVYAFGTKEVPDMKVNDAALVNARMAIPSIVAETELAFQDKAFQKGSTFKPNVLDYVMEIGRRSASTYVDEIINQVPDEKVKLSLKKDPMLEMGLEAQHTVTERTISQMRSEAAIAKLSDKLDLSSLEIDNNVKAKLVQDLEVGIVGDFGEIGWELVNAKWNELIDQTQLTGVIEAAKSLQTKELAVKGQRILDESVDYVMKLKQVQQNANTVNEISEDTQANPERVDPAFYSNLEGTDDIGALNQTRVDNRAEELSIPDRIERAIGQTIGDIRGIMEGGPDYTDRKFLTIEILTALRAHGVMDKAQDIFDRLDKEFPVSDTGSFGAGLRFEIIARTLFDRLVINGVDILPKSSLKLDQRPRELTKSTVSPSIQFEAKGSYQSRTDVNAANADATIAIAVNFESPGERATKRSVDAHKKKYIPIDANIAEITPDRVNKIVGMLNEVNATSINIAGNSLNTLRGKFTQAQVDEYVFDLLEAVTTHPDLVNPIQTIRSGGQTGVDEAGTKAAVQLGIKPIVLAPAGWKFRPETGRDISDEAKFKARFAEEVPGNMFNLPEPIGTYEDILAKWKGGTHAEFMQFMFDNELIQPEFRDFFTKISKYVGDVEVRIQEIADSSEGAVPGQFIPKGLIDNEHHLIYINPKALMYDNFDLFRTSLHEALHAYTYDFLRSGTPEAKKFLAELTQVAIEAKRVLNDPKVALEQGYWLDTAEEYHRFRAEYWNDLTFYLTNKTNYHDELISGVFSSTTNLRDFLRRISAIAAPKATKKPRTLFDKVRAALGKVFASLNKTTPSEGSNLLDKLIDVFTKTTSVIDEFHRKRGHAPGLKALISRSKELEAQYPHLAMKDIPEEQTQLMANQQDDIQEEITISESEFNGIMDILSTLSEQNTKDMRNAISKMGNWQTFKGYIEEFEKKHDNIIDAKLKALYNQDYKNKVSNLTAFKRRYMKGFFSKIANTKTMPHVMIVSTSKWDKKLERSIPVISVETLGETFKIKDIGTGNSYKKTIVLESFLAPLAKILQAKVPGLKTEHVGITYVAGFEARRANGEQRYFANLNYLKPEFFKVKATDLDTVDPFETTKYFADALDRVSTVEDDSKFMVYLGNFGGNNTIPLLTFPIAMKDQIIEALQEFGQAYNDVSGAKAKTNLHNIGARLLLQDLWYKANITQASDVAANTISGKEDANASWKRGKRFLVNENRIIEDAISLKEVFGERSFTGTTSKNGEITLRTTMYSSNDDGSATVTGLKGEKLVVPIQALLRNSSAQQTPRHDGVTWYIIGEFDELYHEVHGTVKDGVIKNVYSSRYGDDPIYIKHAMHGVHRDSPLGRFMRKHNIALLVSDTAVKLPKERQGVRLSDSMDVNTAEFSVETGEIMELTLNKFQRIKEELGTNQYAGPTKQMLNGSGFAANMNDALKLADTKGTFDKHWKEFSTNAAQRSNRMLQELTTKDNLVRVLNDIAQYPESTDEQLVSNMLKGLELNQMSEDEIFEVYGNLINVPHIAEFIRRRLFRVVSDALGGKVGGMRLALTANGGFFTPQSSVNPVISQYNLTDIMINTLPLSDDILKAALPEPELRAIAKEYSQLQREESQMHAKKAFKKKIGARTQEEYLRDRKEELRNMIKSLASKATDPARAKALNSGSIHRVVINAPEVVAWKDKQIAEMLDDQTGTLKDNWVIVTEDYANLKGLKAGDKAILQVTPADSPTGFIAVRIAGIAPVYSNKENIYRKSADRMTVQANSEIIQTIVGKDFDIDSVALQDNDAEFFGPGAFEDIWETMDRARSIFVTKVTATVKQVLGEYVVSPNGLEVKIDEDTAFLPMVREKYAQALMGATQETKETFNPVQDFWFIDNAYLVDPSLIISERLYHTALSAVDFQYKSIWGDLGEITWKARGPRWFIKHLFDLIDTNFSVDFPGQTSKLTYNSNLNDPTVRRRMHSLRFNVDPETVESWARREGVNSVTGHFKVAVADNITQFLFRRAFDLAKGQDREIGQKYNHYGARKALILQQKILTHLQAGEMDQLFEIYAAEKEAWLQSILDESGDTKYYRDQKDKIANMLQEAYLIFNTIKVGNVYDYPLFELIRNMDTKNMPMPGMSFGDWMINQSSATENLVKASSALWNTLQKDIVGQQHGALREFFLRPATVANSVANDILNNYLKYGYFTAVEKGQVTTSIQAQIKDPAVPHNDKLLLLTSDPLLLSRALEYSPEGRVPLIKRMIDEWADLMATIHQPYPADFVKDDQAYHITDKSIALQLLPFYLDVAKGRHTGEYINRISAVRDEIVQLVQLYDEIAPRLSSQTIIRKRWARSVAFPKIFESLLGRSRINLSNKVSNAQLIYKGKVVTVSAVQGGKLVFILEGIKIPHTELKNQAPELYRSLTTQDGLFMGTTANHPGVKNRFYIQQLVDMQANLGMEERLELVRNHLNDRLYNPVYEWSVSDVQGLWASFGGQVTNDALKDSMHDALAPGRMYFRKEQPTHFFSNQIFHALLAEFEPQMFKTLMQELHHVTETSIKIDESIGLAMGSTTSKHAEILNQTRVEETIPRERQRHQYEELAEEIEELAAGTEFKDFMKTVRAEGAPGGMKILRKMLKSTEMMHALAGSDIFYGELVKDIKALSPEKLANKYGDKPYDLISTRVNSYTEAASELGEHFFTEQLDNKHNQLGTIAALWFELNAAMKVARKVDQRLGKLKKGVYGKTSYVLTAPIKEKKIFLSNIKDARIDQIFTPDGVADLTFQHLSTIGKAYSTRIHKGLGLSSVAMAKSQAISTSMNLAHVELSNKVADADDLVLLMTDPDVRQLLYTEEKEGLSPRSTFIRELIDQIDAKISSRTAVEKLKGEDWKPNIFVDINNLAEHLHKETGLRVVSLNGETQYVIPVKSTDPKNPYHEQRIYTSSQKYQMINTVFANLPAYDKLVLLGALDVRELLDVKTPDLMSKVRDYIIETENSLVNSSDTETVLALQAMARRYKRYHDAILNRFGAYIPHEYPIGTYKLLWKEQEKLVVKNQLLERIDINQRLKKQNKVPDYYWANMDLATPEGKRQFEFELEKALEHRWSSLEINEGDATIIPNFLPRNYDPGQGYKIGNSDIYYKYVTKLINGMKEDMLMADVLLYVHKARAYGERSSLIQLTKMYYGDQISNKMMHTKKVAITKVKPGMHVRFNTQALTIDMSQYGPILGDIAVWGVVEKLDKEARTITLKVDKHRMRYNIQRDMGNIKRALDTQLVHEEPVIATKGQMIAVMQLMEQGYLRWSEFSGIELRDVTESEALNLTLVGYQRKLDDEDNWGIYDLDKVFTKDVRGNQLRDKDLQLDRYMRRGSLEYLDAKKREANNIRGVLGRFDSVADEATYRIWQSLVWSGKGVNLVKHQFAMAVMGVVAAPNAFFTNLFGASFMNMVDAPYKDYVYAKRGRRIWKSIKAKQKAKQTAQYTVEEKKWADMFAAFGLKNTQDLVAISLQSGNLSPIELLSGQGFLSNVAYIYKALATSGELGAYLQQQQELRQQFYSTPLEEYDARSKIALQRMQEENLFRMKMDGRIDSYKDLMIPKKLAEKERKGIATIDELNALTSLRAKRATVIAEFQAMRKQGYKPKTSFAFSEIMPRNSTAKLAAKLAYKHLMTGWLGLGLQAKAEALRRPAFWVGYHTALDMGFTEEEAIQYGLNSVEYRHAYYGAGYKQFDANTKLGSFAHMYVQYGWNSFVQFALNVRKAIPQMLSKWYYGKQEHKSYLSRAVDILFRNTKTLDKKGNVIKHDKKEWADVNIVRRLMLQSMFAMVGLQISRNLIPGVRNWMPPIYQAIYGFIEMILDAFAGDLDDKEGEDWAYDINEQIFFLGVPYKLAVQYEMADDESDAVDIYFRGRIEDQVDFWYRAYNTSKMIFDDESVRSLKQDKKPYLDLTYLLDDFIFGIKLFGYSNPDSRQKSYIKTGVWPEFNLGFPPVEFKEERRRIELSKRPTSVDTKGQGIQNIIERIGKYGIGEPWDDIIPFYDRFTEQYEKTRRRGRR